MERNTKILLGALLLGGVGYWYYKKKKGDTTTNTSEVVVKKVAKKLYPNDLKEGDYILIGSDPTVYLLKDGKKLPITYDWFMQYAKDKWDSIIHIDPIDGMDIPVGDTLVV
jgi:LPXTG-motif cell wall-anchored protein